MPVLTGAVAAEPDGPARVEMGWTLKKLKADRGVGAGVPREPRRSRSPDAPQRGGGPGRLRAGLEVFPPLFAEVGTPFGQSLSERPQSTLRKVVEQSNDRRLIPLLVDGLKTGNPEQRALAAQALGLLKPVPREAIAPLAAALRDPEPDVRTSAVYTLTRSASSRTAGRR